MIIYYCITIIANIAAIFVFHKSININDKDKLSQLKFKKENDFWLITGLKLYGPDWRTMISFDKRLAGYPGDAAMPSDLFLLPPVIISGKDKNNE